MTVEVKGLTGFLRHCATVEAEAKALDLKVVASIALDAKVSLIAAAEPHVLSRFANGKGVRLGAHFAVIPGSEPTAILFPTPPGPWYLLERGGSAHQIGRRARGRGGKRGTRGQTGFLGNPGSGFAAVGPVDHPAFASKHTWAHASLVAMTRGSRAFEGKARQQYLKMFVG